MSPSATRCYYSARPPMSGQGDIDAKPNAAKGYWSRLAFKNRNPAILGSYPFEFTQDSERILGSAPSGSARLGEH